MVISYTSGSSLATITFDANIREQHQSTATATDHPVEKGADITDHVRPENDQITVDGFVTNTPIIVPDGTTSVPVTGAVSALQMQVPVKGSLPIGVPVVGAILAGTGALDSTQTVAANVLQFDQPFDRVRSIYEELVQIVKSATLVTIESTVRTYDNMVILNLSTPKSAKDGDAVTFSFVAREIRFADTKQVVVPKTTKPEQKKISKGPKPPAAAKPEASVAYKALNPDDTSVQ